MGGIFLMHLYMRTYIMFSSLGLNIMNKNKLFLLVSITSMCAIVGATVIATKYVHNLDKAALTDATAGNYTLVLDSHNHLDTDDGGASYYSLTSPLNNKVYFDVDDTFVREPDDGWLSLVNGGTFNNPSVFNTSKIMGMKSIRIVSDYDDLKLHYGCEVDGEIVYSNYLEPKSTTIEHTFTPGYEPSYIKIEGYTGTNSNLLESVTIQYSCSESEVTPTENLSYELIEGKEEYRILGFTDRKENIPDDLVIPSHIGEYPVTEIGDDAFNGPAYSTVYGFKSITIPDTVKSIGARAFMSCPAVTKINMPTSGIHLGDDAFLYCGSMETINITKDQVDIDLATYQASPVLTSINVEEGNPKYYSVDGVLYQYSYSDEYVSNKNTLLYCPCAKEGTITIPNDVEYIASSAFKNSKASIIHLGSSIANISENFKSCNSLTDFEVETGNTSYSSVNNMLCKNNIVVAYSRGNNSSSVTIPSSISKVGDYAFDGVSKLEHVTIQGNVEIGEASFANMPSLRSASISSVVVIGDGAFKNCTNLESVALNNVLAVIPTEAFMGCSSLTFDFHVLPSTINTISDRAFKGCSSLSLDSLPNFLESIGTEAFMNCTSLDIDEIPSTVDTLGNGIFRNTAINSLVCVSSLNYIPDDMFRDCASLASITIPNYIRTIGYDAFNGCNNLASVTIPDNSVETIHSKAFYGCNVSNIFIPKCVTLIEGSAFAGGASTIDIDTDVVSPEGQEYSSSLIGGGGWLRPGWSAAFGSGYTTYRIHYSQSR